MTSNMFVVTANAFVDSFELRGLVAITGMALGLVDRDKGQFVPQIEKEAKAPLKALKERGFDQAVIRSAGL